MFKNVFIIMIKGFYCNISEEIIVRQHDQGASTLCYVMLCYVMQYSFPLDGARYHLQTKFMHYALYKTLYFDFYRQK